MAFHEVRLPARLAFGSTGGFERRSTPWAEGRRRYLIGAGLRSLDDMAALTAFSRRGAGGCSASGSATSPTSRAARRARPWPPRIRGSARATGRGDCFA